MSRYNVDPVLADVFGGANDGEVTPDVPDVFEKFIQEAALSAGFGRGDAGRQHAHNLGVEAASREAALTKHYRQIASDAEKKSAGGMKPAAPAPEHVYSAILRAQRVEERTDPLAKSEMSSRLYRLLGELRPHCVDREEELLTKAVRALDISGFAELAETVLRRARQ